MSNAVKSAMPTVTVRIPHNIEANLPALISKPIVIHDTSLGTLTINPDKELTFGGNSRLYSCEAASETQKRLVAKITRSDNITDMYLKISKMILEGELGSEDNVLPIVSCNMMSVETIDGLQECLIEIMPYADSLSGSQLGIKDIKALISCVNNGIKRIHSKNVIHCDIKPSNVFKISNSYYIGDFSSACIKDDVINRTDEFSFTNEVTLTPGYAAPEMYYGRAYFTSDYYSLGVLILSLIHGDNFTELLEKQAFLPFSSDPSEYQLDKEKIEISSLLQCLFEADPRKRGNHETVDSYLKDPTEFNSHYSRLIKGVDYNFFYHGQLVANSESSLMEYLSSTNSYSLLYEGGTSNSLVISYLNRINSTYASAALDVVKGIYKDNFTTDPNSILGMESGLSYLSSLILADGKYRWRKKTYKDLPAVADELQGGVSEDMLALVQSGIMSNSISGKEETEHLFSLIKQGEKIMNDLLNDRRDDISNNTEAKIYTVYRYLYHVLSGDCAAPEMMFKRFVESIDRLDYSNFPNVISLDDWSQLMVYNPTEVFEIVCDTFGKSGYANARKFILLIDKLVDDNNKEYVRTFNFHYGPDALYTYIKKNITMYEVVKSTPVINAISDTNVTETMPVKDQEEQLYIIEGSIRSLFNEFQNNMILTFMNIYDDKYVISHNVNAFFSDDNVHSSGIPFTNGFLQYIEKGA